MKLKKLTIFVALFLSIAMVFSSTNAIVSQASDTSDVETDEGPFFTGTCYPFQKGRSIAIDNESDDMLAKRKNLTEMVYPKQFSKEREKIFELLKKYEKTSLDDATDLWGYKKFSFFHNIWAFSTKKRKERDREYKVKYFGKLKGGKPTGDGILLDADGGLLYAGSFKNGYFFDYGMEFEKYNNIIVREGKYNKGSLNGKGIQYKEFLSIKTNQDLFDIYDKDQEDEYFYSDRHFDIKNYQSFVEFEGDFKWNVPSKNGNRYKTPDIDNNNDEIQNVVDATTCYWHEDNEISVPTLHLYFNNGYSSWF